MPQPEVTFRHPTNSSSYAEDFSRGLVDPHVETPANILGLEGKRASRRYNVYRNNVTVSLIDALASIYPCVQRSVGEDFFRAMARSHIRASPPTSPLLFEYGHDFPAFIEHYEYAQSIPWLADVARIERAWLNAYHAADIEPLSADSLASIPAERLADLRFAPHPSTKIVCSHYPVLSIFAANRSASDVGSIDGTVPEDALITRPYMEVIARHLPTGGAEFLSSLVSGEPLGVAASRALDACPSFDIAANVVGMIEAGAFSAIVLEGA